MVLWATRFIRRGLLTIALFVALITFYLWTAIYSSSYMDATAMKLPPITATKDFFLNNPLGDEDFGEMGQRVQMLRRYLEESDHFSGTPSDLQTQMGHIEEMAISMFPFLKNPASGNSMPLRALRQNFPYGSKGIVIPTGVMQFRFTAHLISSLRNVIKSPLPIQVAYCGEDDLPKQYREALLSLGSDIDTLDVSTIFDNELLRLEGTWAVKPFALLASKFEQSILLDADAVMVQDPRVVFNYPGYLKTGTYLFHDRLLWQHMFQERHEWWRNQTTNHALSPALMKSLVWTEEYAEEQDSGMVVLDKSHLGIFTALLHICWQNSRSVRDAVTYRITYGDKESWWFGLELSGNDYMFEASYGSIAGYVEDGKVCSFNIAHPDAVNGTKLLWYNGSLLKNKEVSMTEFLVPEFWMRDAKWLKGGKKIDMSCMTGGKIRKLDPEQVSILRMSVEEAKRIDNKFKALILDPEQQI